MINEFVATHSGEDTYEYIEIAGAPDTDYANLTILQIEGDIFTGSIDTIHRIGSTDSQGLWTTEFFADRIENGTMSLLLVDGFSGAQGDDLDPDDDGILDERPWASILDGIAVHDGDEGDHVFADTVLLPAYDGFEYPPGGASRIPNAVNTGTQTSWVRNDFYLAGLAAAPSSAPIPGQAFNTPQGRNRLSGEDSPTEPNPDSQPIARSIREIQFSSDPSARDASVYENTHVSVEGILTVLPGQYAIQSPSQLLVIQNSAGEAWSGLVVFSPNGFSGFEARVGSRVLVRGAVQEYYGLTEVVISNDMEDVTILSLFGDQVVPAKIEADALAAPSTAEALEGMLVEIQDVVVTEPDLEYGEWSFGDKNGSALAGSLGVYAYQPWRHDVLQRLRGIVWYGFGQYKIQPRSDADIRLLAMAPTMR